MRTEIISKTFIEIFGAIIIKKEIIATVLFYLNSTKSFTYCKIMCLFVQIVSIHSIVLVVSDIWFLVSIPINRIRLNN